MKRRMFFSLVTLAVFLLSFAQTAPAHAYAPNLIYPLNANYYVTPSTLAIAFRSDGPCYRMSGCTIDAYAERPNSINLIVKGKRWVWSTKDRKYTSKAVLLTSISRFKSGPCAELSGTLCQFRTYMFYTNASGVMREAAYVWLGNGMISYWVWDLNSHAVIYHDVSPVDNGSGIQPSHTKPRP